MRYLRFQTGRLPLAWKLLHHLSWLLLQQAGRMDSWSYLHQTGCHQLALGFRTGQCQKSELLHRRDLLAWIQRCLIRQMQAWLMGLQACWLVAGLQRESWSLAPLLQSVEQTASCLLQLWKPEGRLSLIEQCSHPHLRLDLWPQREGALPLLRQRLWDATLLMKSLQQERLNCCCQRSLRTLSRTCAQCCQASLRQSRTSWTRIF